jgi:serine/threonine-protein kinase
MSPEQLSGDKVDGRSDIYSLALVLYKMLTGKLPFEATTAQETMLKRLTDEPLPLGAARPDLRFPPGLQQTVDAALTRSPAERYQSVAKFVNDVASVAGLQRGVGPLAPLPATRGGEEQTQVLEPARTGGLERPGPRPGSATRRRSRVPIILGAVAVLGGGGAAVAVLGGGRQTSGAARPDTATRVAGGNPVEAAERPPQATLPTARQRVATASARVDSAAVHRDLGSILELVGDPATAEAGRRRATTYYENADVPTPLRAQAAFMVAQGYFIKRNNADACRWNGRALRLAPANATYLTFKRDQGCP